MKKIFKILLIQNSLNKPWYKLIFWWEFRRVLYNVFLILSLILSVYLMIIIPGEGYLKLYAGPITSLFIISVVTLYFLGANILYTFGWVFQLFTRELPLKILERHSKRLFIYGLAFSLIVTLFPVLLVILNIILPETVLESIHSAFLDGWNYINSL